MGRDRFCRPNGLQRHAALNGMPGLPCLWRGSVSQGYRADWRGSKAGDRSRRM